MNVDILLECEDNFTACFSEIFEDNNVIRFRDDQIKDMYDHNYTIIKEDKDYDKLSSIIQEEIDICKGEGKNYCVVRLNSSINVKELKNSDLIPEIVNYGLYYTEDVENFCVPGNLNCEIHKVDNKQRVKDRYYVEEISYHSSYGNDFSKRKAERNAAVYLAPNGVDSYVCYVYGNPIGKADLFIHKGVAMIEDFDIIPEFQRKGYGTAIINHLITLAVKNGIHSVFMVTDMDDTAKEMYVKLGFKYAPGRRELFYKI